MLTLWVTFGWGRTAAAEERWTEALAIYDEALARDPSLQFAINGKAADSGERESVTRFDDLPAAFPQDRFALGSQRKVAEARARGLVEGTRRAR